MALPDEFKAVVYDRDAEPDRATVQSLSPSDLPEGDTTIRVHWSSVNYKDALAATQDGRVAQINPLVPGIDLAGEILESDSDDLAQGDEVLVHGYELGVARHGGYSEYARVPSSWVVPLPVSLSGREAMILGTAGFTAAMSIIALENHGLETSLGPVLVTGATGGVGSTAVSILAERGYEVVASTGKGGLHDWLRRLGASRIVERFDDPSRPLEEEMWAGVVDCTGGGSLASILTQVRYRGAVAACGLTAGTDLETTVFPFILRAVSLLGIDSVQCPLDLRRRVWDRLSDDLRPPDVSLLDTREVKLDDLPAVLKEPLRGQSQGRTVVNVAGRVSQ